MNNAPDFPSSHFVSFPDSVNAHPLVHLIDSFFFASIQYSACPKHISAHAAYIYNFEKPTIFKSKQLDWVLFCLAFKT